jgi:hypothetical protein
LQVYKDGQPGKLNDIWKVEPESASSRPMPACRWTTVTRKAIEACTKAGKWEPAKG